MVCWDPQLGWPLHYLYSFWAPSRNVKKQLFHDFDIHWPIRQHDHMNRQSTDSKPAAVRHPRKAQGLGHISYDLLQALPCANVRQQRAWDDEMVPMLYSKIIVFLLHWTLAESFGGRKSWDQLMIQLQLDHNERVSSQVTKLRDHPPPTPHPPPAQAPKWGPDQPG